MWQWKLIVKSCTVRITADPLHLIVTIQQQIFEHNTDIIRQQTRSPSSPNVNPLPEKVRNMLLLRYVIVICRKCQNVPTACGEIQ